jgi:hypothetical protein
VEKLHHHHHSLIMLCMVLVVLVTGIVFGVKISNTTRGTDGLLIIVFALSFLSIVMSFLIFTQLVHLREALQERRKR